MKTRSTSHNEIVMRDRSLRALQVAVHGKKFARVEMAWALQMALCGEKNHFKSAELDAQYRAALRRNLEPIVEELCRAAAAGRASVFRHLAECVEKLRKRSVGVWHNETARALVAWAESNPRQKLNVLEFAEINGLDAKTVRKHARELGLPMRTQPGRPRKLGK